MKQNQIEGNYGSKRKYIINNNNNNNRNNQNIIEESNSKKRISWGGIHTRWFNEQENKNWDVSPESLKSGSEKSRSIDVQNMTDDNILDNHYQPHINTNNNILQNTNNNVNQNIIKLQQPQQQQQLQQLHQQQYRPQQQIQQQMINQPTQQFDRLSVFFKEDKQDNNHNDIFLNGIYDNQNQLGKYQSNDSQQIAGISKRLSSPAGSFQPNQNNQLNVQNNQYNPKNIPLNAQTNYFNAQNNQLSAQNNYLNAQNNLLSAQTNYFNGQNNQQYNVLNQIGINDQFGSDGSYLNNNNDSESCLVDNLDRLSRLSALFNDSENNQLSSKEDDQILSNNVLSSATGNNNPSNNQQINSFNKNQNIQSNSNNVQINNNNVLSNNNINDGQKNIFQPQQQQIVSQQKNQINNTKQNDMQYFMNNNNNNNNNNSNNSKVVQNQQNIQNQQNTQLNYPQRQTSSSQNKNIPSTIYQNKIIDSTDINQNLFKNYYNDNKTNSSKEINNLNDIGSKKEYSRLSEYIKQDLTDQDLLISSQNNYNNNIPSSKKSTPQSQQQQQPQQLQQQQNVQKPQPMIINKPDQMIFDSTFSSTQINNNNNMNNTNNSDQSKRLYPFSLGFESDIFNESKSSNNDSSSYLLEYQDKVNRLSEVHNLYKNNDNNPNLNQSIINNGSNSKDNRASTSAIITPSPLMNDLKNLTLDLQDDDEDNYDDQQFNSHIHSSIRIAKEKRVRMKEDLDSIKSNNIFNNQSDHNDNDVSDIDISIQNVHQLQQNKPKSILNNSKMINESNNNINNSIIVKQKNQMLEQMNQLRLNNNSTNGKISPNINISKSIQPNSSISQEISKIVNDMSKDINNNNNNLKGQQNNQIVKNSKNKNVSFDEQFINDDKENTNNNIHNSIKRTPNKKQSILKEQNDIDQDNSDDDDINEDNKQNINSEELGQLVLRMPMNSYDKKVILNYLTPYKSSKNLSMIRQSLQFNHNNNNQNKNQIQQNLQINEQINNINHEYQLSNDINNNEPVKDIEEMKQILNDQYLSSMKEFKQNIETSSENIKSLQLIVQKNQEEIEKEEAELLLLEQELQTKKSNNNSNNTNQTNENNNNNNNMNDNLNINELIKKQLNSNILFNNQYYQAYQIITNYFGYEYLGKIKDAQIKGEFIAFRFLNKYMCSIQMAKTKQNDKISLVFIRGIIDSIVNSNDVTLSQFNKENNNNNNNNAMNDENNNNNNIIIQNKPKLYSDLLTSPNISQIVQDLMNKKYKNYITNTGNLISVLQYVGCKLSELEELYKQMKIITTIYTVNNFYYNIQSQKISFTLTLTHFPFKLIQFNLSTESWYNDISIQIINKSKNNNHGNRISGNNQSSTSSGVDYVNEKINEEIDKSINTQFNSKINSQSSYTKLRNIIDAINVKNQIDSSHNESHTQSRLSNSNVNESSTTS